MPNAIDFMIQAKRLNELLQEGKNLVIIDVRSHEEYTEGHIESAVNFPELFTYLPEGITTQKEKDDFVAYFKELFSKAGVAKGALVVFYEERFTLKSPRGLTILKYLGYDENSIKVLDGGYFKWSLNAYPTSTKISQNARANFSVKVDEEFFIDYNEMLAFVDDKSVKIIDVRDEDEWLGISSSPFGIDFAPKKGRILNAESIEWYRFITDDMLSVRSLREMKRELQKKNIKKKDTIILYCFKGARLSNTYIALRKLNYSNIKIYFAGWNEWSRKEGAPIINEAQNSKNPLLKENIALKNRLEEIHLKDANLIDFPKYNKEPIFAFNREGEIVFENKPKKEKLPKITKISDIYSQIEPKDIYNIIDNKEQRSKTIKVDEKYYLLNLVGSRGINRILVYGFETTKVEQLNAKLKSQYSLMQNIINTIPVRIFYKDLDLKYIGANRLLLDDLGFKDEKEILGKTDFEMPWGETEGKQYREDDIGVLQSGVAKLNYEEIQTLKDSEVRVFLSSKVPLQDSDGKIIGILGVASDITHQREMEIALKKQKDVLYHQAHHDVLTGLPNRVMLRSKLNHAIENTHQNESKIAMMFLDLDHFKEINDSLGHDKGDEVLKHIAQRLSKAVREDDTIARLGGDEFVVLLENLESAEEVSLLAQKILELLERPIDIDGNRLYVSSSIGVSIYPDDGKNFQNLLKFADSAMYHAKSEGRNNFQFYNKRMTELAFERIAMEASLRDALEKDEFVIYFQPQVNAQEQKLVGMEALVRWQHPRDGLIFPDKFIPLAESTGMIVELDRLVMKKAMLEVSQWYKEGLNPGILSMNLSVKQIQQQDFLVMFEELMRVTKCRAEWLELEVTESQIMVNPQAAIKVLKGVSDFGVSLAVDDFGTGYSSLAYLKKLPINKLKIDREFIKDLPEDEEDAAITRTIIALAQALNLEVVAEGVETKTQKEFLLANACKIVQGYFYSKPVEAKSIRDLLENGIQRA